METITLKCLAKKPAERYATAGELAADLRRWLDDKPIQAKPPTLLQQATRRWRRHPRAFAAAFAVAVLAAVGAGVSTFLIDRRKQRAEDRLQTARAAVDDMYIRVAEEWLDDEPGLTEVQKKFLHKALQFYRQFGDESGADPAVRSEAAQAWYRVARIQFKLGNRAEAEAACRQAITRSEALAADFPGEPKYRAAMAMASQQLCNVLQGPAAVAERVQAGLRAVDIQPALPTRRPRYPATSPTWAGATEPWVSRTPKPGGSPRPNGSTGRGLRFRSGWRRHSPTTQPTGPTSARCSTISAGWRPREMIRRVRRGS